MNGTTRVAPRIWIGVASCIGFLALPFAVLLAAMAIPGGSTVAKGIQSGEGLLGGIPQLVGAVALVALVTALGWWRPVMHESRRLPRWSLLVPAILLVPITASLLSTNWVPFDSGFVATALLVNVLVGVNEEILTRGVVLVATRSRLNEIWVWLFSSGLFAVIHFVNVLVGQDLASTAVQVVFAFFMGTVFYVLRRATGTLVWPIVIHAVWDFRIDMQEHSSNDLTAPLAWLLGALPFAAGIVGCVVVPFLVLRGTPRPALDLQSAGRAHPRP